MTKTMQEIERMTGKELAEFMTSNFYEGVSEGLYFIMNIEDYKVGYTLEVDNKGLVAKALDLGLLKADEIGDLDELSEDKINSLVEIYNVYDDAIDKSLIETMRDEIIEEIKTNLEEAKEQGRKF